MMLAMDSGVAKDGPPSIGQMPGDDCPAQIKRLRARLGLTQAALAERIGVSFPTINRWENGKSRPSQLSWSQILSRF